MILSKLIAGKPAPGPVAEVAGIAVAKPTEQHPVDSGSVAKIAGIAVATPVSSELEQSAPSSEAELATAIVAIPATQTPSEAPKDRAGLLAALAAAREGLPLSLDQLVQAFGAEGESDWLEGYAPHCRPEFLRAFAEAVAARLAREQAGEPEPEPTSGPLDGLALLREDWTFIESRTRGRRNRESLLAEYARRWTEAAEAEPVEVRKANAGRFAANTWLREAGK